MKTSKIKFLPAILAASVLTLTSCEKDELMESPTSTTSESGQDASIASGNRYLITLKDNGDGSSPDQRVQNLLNRGRFSQNKMGKKIFGKVFNGITAELTPEEVEKLRADDNVALVEADQIIALGNKGKGGGGTTTTTSTTTTQPTTTTTTTSPTTTTTSPTTTTTTTTTSTSLYPVAAVAGQTISWGATRVGIGDGAATGRTAWIVDSGIQLDHPDLNVDVARSRSFISASTSPNDEYGHGTQVAGIVAAKNNGYGVVGIAAGATVVSLRVMDAAGAGSISSVVSALNHIAANGTAGDVVNLSLGAGPSTTLDNAVLSVANLGIFVTIAAGNSNANSANYSPARVNHTNVFTVSGLRPDGTFMGISNWGTPVDYCAPGTGLQSTKTGSGYGSVGGTSMAAPHVAGILLMRGNTVVTDGHVLGDPDGSADPISVLTK